jgi:hypothetical protein
VPECAEPVAQFPLRSCDLTGAPAQPRRIPPPVAWGAVVGVVMAASSLARWWLDPSTVYALGLVLIASVSIGAGLGTHRRGWSPPPDRDTIELRGSREPATTHRSDRIDSMGPNAPGEC